MTEPKIQLSSKQSLTFSLDRAMSGIPEYKVGPFTLGREIARGSYGNVYLARHSSSDTPVALKMLTSSAAQRPGVASALRREVETMAKLHHPGIAAVVDMGVIEDAFELDGEQMAMGTPWIAMEYVGGQPSSSYEGHMTWPELQRFLYDLLDALAYAHAQGIVHRDIKPDNIMIVRDGNRLRPKLVDFGIARALDEDDKDATRRPDDDTVVGTPKYMSPEQIMGFWRDEGPQTDLYSLGCVAWRFVTGAAPFRGENSIEILNQHVHAEPPDFEPSMDVPAGLEPWLRSLLEKHPNQRVRRAASAARALMELPRSVDEPATCSSVDKKPTVRSLADQLDSARPPLPELPEHWDALTQPRPPVQLAGAGLSLYGLRTVPIVGRLRERDQLWAALKHVRDMREHRLIWLTGEAGTGKSRLAEWVSQRAHAAGAFEVLKAVHGSDGGGPRDGLGAMLVRHFDCVGMSRDEMAGRLADLFETYGWTDRVAEYDRGVYLEMMAPLEPNEQEAPTPKARSMGERYLAVERLLERIAGHQPVVLWLDDAGFSGETLGFIEFLARQTERSELPVLTLVTTRRADLNSAAVQHAFDAALTSEHTRHLQLPRLDREHMHELVTRLLGLEDALAKRLVERADGRPLFAVQIVDGWVERDELEVGEDGFRLRNGVDASLPDDIHQMWLQRIDRLLTSFARNKREYNSGWRALEAAAILGQEVASREWLACCGAAGISIPGKLVPALAARNLVSRADGGWAFVHALLRESLIRHARERGFAQTHHESCASGLDNLYGGTSPRLGFRRARHLVAAGYAERALELIERAAIEFFYRGEPERGAEACDFHAELIEKLDPPDQSRARAAQWRLRAQLLRTRGDLREARHLAERALNVTRAEGYRELHARAMVTYGVILVSLGQLGAGAKMLEEAGELAQALGMNDVVAVSYRNAGIARQYNGELERGCAHLRRALEAYEETGNRSGQACARALIASIDRHEDTVFDAINETREALDVARQTGDRYAIGHICNSLAELYRFEGELHMAARYYEEAHAHCKACGSNDRYVILVNLMLTELARGKYDSVLDLSEPLLEMARTQDWEFSSFVLLGDAIGRVVNDDYELAGAHTREAVEKAVHADPDHLTLANHLAEQLKTRGWNDILEDVLAFEENQRRMMSDRASR